MCVPVHNINNKKGLTVKPGGKLIICVVLLNTHSFLIFSFIVCVPVTYLLYHRKVLSYLLIVITIMSVIINCRVCKGPK